MPAKQLLRRRLLRLHLAWGVGVRKLVPMRCEPIMVHARSAIGRRRPGRMQQAVDNMRLVVGEQSSSADLQRLATAHLVNTSWRRETRWRPELVNHQQVVGLENLRTALEAGRGCLLSFVHHGDYTGAFASVTHHGFDVSVLCASDMFDPDSAVWLHAHRRAVGSAPGVRLVDVSGGSAAVRAELAAGRTLAVATDPSGHTRAHVFGRDLMVASGGLRSARELDVPVVLMTSRRPPGGHLAPATVVLSPPVQASDFDSFEALHAAVLSRHEEAMLAWPEAVDRLVQLMSNTASRVSTEYQPPTA